MQPLTMSAIWSRPVKEMALLFTLIGLGCFNSFGMCPCVLIGSTWAMNHVCCLGQDGLFLQLLVVEFALFFQFFYTEEQNFNKMKGLEGNLSGMWIFKIYVGVKICSNHTVCFR